MANQQDMVVSVIMSSEEFGVLVSSNAGLSECLIFFNCYHIYLLSNSPVRSVISFNTSVSVLKPSEEFGLLMSPNEGL